ncbi:MAG: 50S ribosomal protein L25/general stress protein Ctc [Alteromonadaceae bacterium]|nr:MAG: 50S ribosomal protein L25/general stress protein Ctc [Alteromonadaceae bacterium]
MSTTDFTLNVLPRETSGKGASRRLRREHNLVPAIIYGGKAEPQNISILFKDFVKQLENEAFYSHIITLNVDGKSEQVILKDLQRHPATTSLLYHADFLRVDSNTKIHTKVPLHFINEAESVGVKQQGGAVSHNITQLDITCLPGNLPEFIEVDLAALEMGQALHISDLTLPEGVESVALNHGASHDQAVANIHKPKGITDEGEGEGEGEATEAAAPEA